MRQQPLPEERVTALVHDAAAAPSMHNAQPWRFRYFQGSRTFHVRADSTASCRTPIPTPVPSTSAAAPPC